jgi:hypothetical protein
MKDNKIYIQLQQKTNFQVSTQQKDCEYKYLKFSSPQLFQSIYPLLKKR